MTWFRVDDGFDDHPAVVALADGPCFESAIALWLLCGTWSAKHLTAGFVPVGRVTRSGVARCALAAGELVRVGLWEEEAKGFRFKHWDQPSRKKRRRLNTGPEAKSNGVASSSPVFDWTGSKVKHL